MKRPVFWLGLCFLAGETLGLVITPDSRWSIILIACIIMIILWIFTGRQKSVWLLVLPVFFIIGYLHLSDAMIDAIEKDRVLAKIHKRNFLGEVRDVEEKENCFFVYLERDKDIFLVVVMKEDMPLINLISGYKVEVCGEIECFSVPTNEGMFNEWLYYHAKGVDARIWADSIAFISDDSRLMDRWMFKIKNYIIQNCRKNLSKISAGIAISMLTGERGWLDNDVKELYQLSGIAHILAISGLHISFIGMGIYSFLRRLKVHPYVCAFFAVSVLFFYGVFTGMAPSTLRAVIMTGLHIIAKGCGHCYDRKTAYGLAMIVVLWKSPLIITQSGFMLSFGAVGCLIFSERFLPKYIKHAKGIVKWRNKVLNVLIPSFAVTMGMMPLTAFNFCSIPLYAMFLNLAIMPLMSILYSAMLFIGVFGKCLSPLSIGIEWILRFYEKLCVWSLMLPGSVVTCGKPGIGWMIVIYGGMFVLLWFVQRCNIVPIIKRIAVILGCMMPLFLLLSGWSNKLMITMLDVGQGDCFLISLPSGENLLVDGGSSDVNRVGEYRLIPHLKAKGINYLDAVFLSHLDTDHTSAVLELLASENTIRIEQVILPVLSSKSESKEKFTELMDMKPERCYMTKAGDVLSFSDLKIQVLWPDEAAIPDDANEGSLVLFMEYQDFRILFTGDVGTATETKILETLDSLSCHILKVAHHGSKYSTSKDFLEKVSPKAALISSGKDNTYGHPHKELLDRLKMETSYIYNTAQMGQITLYKTQKRIKVVVWKENGVYNRYVKALRMKN